MKIAIAQLNTNIADLTHTLERMREQSILAAEQGVDLLLFPSAALVGPYPGGLTESEEFMCDLVIQLGAFAKQVKVPCLIPIAFDVAEGIVRDVVFVNGGKARPLVMANRAAAMMRRLSNEQGEEEDAAQLDFAGLRLGLAFSYYELEAYTRGYADEKCDVILYFSSESYNTDDDISTLAPAVAEGAFVQLASDANAWLVAVGSVGGYDELSFAGGSFVMAPWGELAAAAPSFEEALLVCDFDPMAEGPLAHPVLLPVQRRVALLWDALVTCLRDFVLKGEVENVVVPITGQLTSAVATVLAVDALGPQRVHAVMLPSHERLGTADFCRKLALNLRIGFEDPLSADLGEKSRALSRSMQAWRDNRANVKRLHRDLANVMLAHRARELNAAVLGISDKTEMALEWLLPAATSAAFEPLGDVYRSDVAELARWRNTASPVIPPEVIDCYDVAEDLAEGAPSTEIALSTIDAILYLHIERGLGLSAIAREGFDEGLVKLVLERVGACALQRRAAALMPMISQRPFADRAWPINCAWHDSVRDESMVLEAQEQLRESMAFQPRGEGAESAPTGDDLLRMLGFEPEPGEDAPAATMDDFWNDLMG